MRIDSRALEAASDLMIRALGERVFTGAALLVHQDGARVLSQYLGAVGEPGAGPIGPRSLFDLASLTKVLATTPCWMSLTAGDPAILDRPLAAWFPDASGDKRNITPRQLLAHSSGLPAWRPYYLYGDIGPVARLVRERVLGEPLAYRPTRGMIYSDLGFMILAAIAEMESGTTFSRFAEQSLFKPLNLTEDLLFSPDPQIMQIVGTRPSDKPGLVNDLNTRALGGVSGHAGLFGTAEGVARMAGEILRSLRSEGGHFSQEVVRTFATRAQYVPDSTRALGFDTPSEQGSSSGRLFPRTSLGHTGFTGVSLWMDIERGITVTLLTNRVYMGESDPRIKSLRPALHDAVMEGFVWE